MASTLPALPAEILYIIIDHARGGPWRSPRVQMKTFQSLRATCREINAKTMSLFGSRYFRKISVCLDEQGMEWLTAISQSNLRGHVHSINIDTDSIMTCHSTSSASEASDGDSHSWIASNSGDGSHHRYAIDKDVIAFFSNGSCAHLLGQTLPRLIQFKDLVLSQPWFHYTTKAKHRKRLAQHWSASVKALFSITLSKGPPLRKILLNAGAYEPSLPVRMSVLDPMSTFMLQLVPLEALAINLDVDEGQGMYSLICTGLANMAYRIVA
jgi:hypothetical protein